MSLSTSAPQELEGNSERSERYLPSFEHVLSLGQPSLRLPRYRLSHRLRYHPYPRYKPFVIPDDFLDDVYPRQPEEDLASISTLVLSPEDEEHDTSTANLQQAMDVNQEKTGRIRRLSILVVDLAFLSLRRALETLYITKDKDADAVLAKDKKK